MIGWRHSTVEVAAPSSLDPRVWARLGTALLDAVALGYRAVRLTARRCDRRIEVLLGPVIATGVHTQLCLDAAKTKRAVDTSRLVGVGTWLVAAPPSGSTDSAITAVTDALGQLARRDRRRGVVIPLTTDRARDLEAMIAAASGADCSCVVLRSDVAEATDTADDLERAMAYVTARRAGRDVMLRIDLDLIEREHVARHLASSLTTSAPLTRQIPTLVISAEGQVDPLRAGIVGYGVGNLADASLLQLLARWRTGCGPRWVALHRAMITHVGRADAWPVVDWTAELAKCARRVARGLPRARAAMPLDATAPRRRP